MDIRWQTTREPVHKFVKEKKEWNVQKSIIKVNARAIYPSPPHHSMPSMPPVSSYRVPRLRPKCVAAKMIRKIATALTFAIQLIESAREECKLRNIDVPGYKMHNQNVLDVFGFLNTGTYKSLLYRYSWTIFHLYLRDRAFRMLHRRFPRVIWGFFPLTFYGALTKLVFMNYSCTLRSVPVRKYKSSSRV